MKRKERDEIVERLSMLENDIKKIEKTSCKVLFGVAVFSLQK